MYVVGVVFRLTTISPCAIDTVGYTNRYTVCIYASKHIWIRTFVAKLSAIGCGGCGG